MEDNTYRGRDPKGLLAFQLMALAAMQEKKDDVFTLTNPYANLPCTTYAPESDRPRKKYPLTNKQKKARNKNRSAKQSRKNNRKKK